jgi:hypothetical protein
MWIHSKEQLLRRAGLRASLWTLLPPRNQRQFCCYYSDLCKTSGYEAEGRKDGFFDHDARRVDPLHEGDHGPHRVSTNAHRDGYRNRNYCPAEDSRGVLCVDLLSPAMGYLKCKYFRHVLLACLIWAPFRHLQRSSLSIVSLLEVRGPQIPTKTLRGCRGRYASR